MDKNSESNNKHTFYQVWNDSVVVNDLAKAILINIILTSTFLFSSIYILSFFVSDPNIMKGYSLLIGLIGCVLGAVLCMSLYKPKRIINTDIENNDNLYTTVCELVDYDTTASIATLPESSKQELIELGLYDVFLRAEQENQKQKVEEK